MGRLILPPDNHRKTTLIWLGGSEGGMGAGGYLNSLLATKGYAVFALAYFGAEGLPEELEEIPLKVFPAGDRLVELARDAAASRGSGRLTAGAGTRLRDPNKTLCWRRAAAPRRPRPCSRLGRRRAFC